MKKQGRELKTEDVPPENCISCRVCIIAMGTLICSENNKEITNGEKIPKWCPKNWGKGGK